MLDIIGTIYTSGEYDAEGNILVEPQPLEGFHVNCSREVPQWLERRVTPDTPLRVFGGCPTFHYRFSSLYDFEISAFEAGFVRDEETNTWSDPADSEPPQEVPRSVSLRQAKLALLQLGVFDAVLAAIQALPSPQRETVQVEWEYANEVHRTSPWVQALAPAIGITSEAQLDDLFRLAATL